MSEKQIFEALLEKHQNTEATVINLPFDAEQVFGAKRFPVWVKINKAEHRTTVFRTKGRYMVVVPKAFREAAGVRAGEKIKVEMERDAEPRLIDPPADLSEALDANPAAKEVWERLSYTHKKEFARAVEAAKRTETRERRVRRTIEELLKKK